MPFELQSEKSVPINSDRNPYTDSQKLAETFRQDCLEFSKNPKIGAAPILDDIATARAGNYFKDFAAELREHNVASVEYNNKNEPTAIEFAPPGGGAKVEVDLVHDKVELK